MSQPLNLEHLCKKCVIIAREAGERILKIYNSYYSIEQKNHKSPLTDADLATHNTKGSLLNPFFFVFGDTSRDWSAYLEPEND